MPASALRRSRRSPAVTETSFIDLFATLFVIAVSLLVEARPSQMPTPVQAQVEDKTAVVVKISAEGVFVARDGPLAVADLPARLAGKSVVLDVAANVDAGREHAVLAALVGRGLHVAVRLPAAEPQVLSSQASSSKEIH